MKLITIIIQNYRSIDDITINIKEDCLILLGINETGKTNILRGISAISDDFKFDYKDDAKIPINHADFNYKDPIIKYDFELLPEEKKAVIERAFGEEYNDWPFKYNTEHCKSLKEFIVNFIGQTSYELTFEEDNSNHNTVFFTIPEKLINLKPRLLYCNNQIETIINEKKRVITPGEILDTKDIDNYEEVKQQFRSLTKKDIIKKASVELGKFVRDSLPNIVYWEYEPKYLLTDSIDIATFKDNPDICIPLRNIFWLAGIDEIKARIDRDYNNDSAFHNLKKILSEAATQHLRRVWKDYKGISIIINERNGKFSIQVKDKKNLYDFKQRSDGFKRFISFLFILSAEYQKNELYNTILLFDEPETSLHPSGTRHLLKEIIELSNGNYSFIATHSIFFIDREKISRHLMVTKENECTKIESVSKQNFAEEEVLFQALGFSYYDILKSKSLCFEGWTDKELFLIFTNLFKNDITGLVDFLKDYGILWSSGASKICQTIKPFVSDNRRFFAIADFDIAGKKEKGVFEKEFGKTKSRFYTYKDFSRRQLTELTLEDMLPVSIMLDFFNEYLKAITENPPKPRFSKARIIKSGIVNSWKNFCGKEYSSIKDKLIHKYKNKLPEYIQKYLDENTADIERVKREFNWYKSFIEKLIEKTKK